MSPFPIQLYLLLGAFLFCIGLVLLLSKKHAIAALMGIELMLNACNLNLVAFNRLYAHDLQGQAFALFVMVVAAAEIAIALALVIQVYKHYQSAHLS
jgi:NADH-quinone oxidoreductase subunit K